MILIFTQMLRGYVDWGGDILFEFFPPEIVSNKSVIVSVQHMVDKTLFIYFAKKRKQ